jgi:hypothetical protein
LNWSDVVVPEKIPHESASLSGNTTTDGLVKLHLTAGLGSGQTVIVRPGFVREAIKALEMLTSGRAVMVEVGPFTQGKARAMVEGDGTPIIGG